jgi:hypothetical protein
MMEHTVRQVLPDRHLHRRQPPAGARPAQRAGQHPAQQLAQLRPPRLPGLRRGARRALRHRRGDAGHQRPADRRQRHRLPGGVLHALPRNLVADALDPLAVRQHRGRGHRHRGGHAGQGRDHVRVVAQGGDGGTTDIGFGCLSGMFERNDDVLYICYDNEAYMNTGVQRSRPRRRPRAPPPPCRSAEPGQRLRPGQEPAASPWRTRFPTCHRHRGRPARPGIQGHQGHVDAAARATSTSLCPARSAGARPRTTPSAGAAGARRAVSSRCSRPSAARSRGSPRSAGSVPVEDYLRPQKRFAHLFGKHAGHGHIARLQAMADRNIRRYGLLDEEA